MDMQTDLFAEFSYGKVALEKIKPLSPNFRLYSAGWIDTGTPDTWEVMEVSGAEFRPALRGKNKGKLTVMVPYTKRTVHVHVSEMKSHESKQALKTKNEGEEQC